MTGRLIIVSPCCLTSERIADVFSPVRLARGPVTLTVKEKKGKGERGGRQLPGGFVSI